MPQHPPPSRSLSHNARIAARLLGLLAMWALLAASPAMAKPNIVVILVDDLDHQTWQTALDLGLLPRIRSDLINRGTQFSESFVAEPLCCPSRATYLTGQYPHNHGVQRNTGVNGGFASFNDASTLPVWLQQAGYRTGHVGKYLNGYNRRDYVPPGWNTWNALLDGAGTYCMYNYSVTRNGGTPTSYGETPADYKTDVLAGLAVDFIRAADGRPFFLNVAPTAPHYEDCVGNNRVRAAPRHLGSVNVALPAASRPSFNEADMADKPAWMRTRPPVDAEVQRVFFNEMVASMRAVDDLVGRVVDALRERNELPNTMIIFTSDNGLQFGTHRLLNKRTFYEESIRVPLVVRKASQDSARTVDYWALNIDLAPTIVDFAGASAGLPADGRSLRPVLGGTSTTWRKSVLLEYPFVDGTADPQRPYFAIRTKDRDLTSDSNGQKAYVYAETLDGVTGAVSDMEYYDLTADPWQIGSLHLSTNSQHVQRMSRMKARLELLKACKAATCRQHDQ